jgi:hypothetical protein
MPKVCSIEASKLSPTDAAAYKSRRKHSTQLAFVETRLPIAKRELAMVVAEAHSAHPDLIDKNGDFFEDLLAKQFEEDARQANMFTKKDQGGTARVRADLARRSVADPRVVEADDTAASQKAAAEKLGAGGSPNLAAMSQEEYAAHLAETGLPEGVSAYDALTASPELRGLNAQQRVDLYIKSKDAAQNFTARMSTLWVAFRGTTGGVRAIGADSGWTNFEVGTDRASDGQVRHKSYASLSDFINITNEELTGFLEAMDMLGFNGQVKFPGMGSRALLGFDNIVMHGATQRDALLGQKIAQDYFGGRVTGTQVGADANGKSHTQLMADALEATNAKPNRNTKAAKDAEAEREAKAAEARAAEAERKAKEEAGRKKSGAERLARKKQPGGAGKAGAGTTTKPASGQGAANLKAKGKGGTADTSNQKKSASETVQSEPTGTEQPQPAVGKEQQPTSVSGITPEAAAFIVAAEQGMPGSVTNNLRRIADENGVPHDKNTKPEDILAALKAKQEAATTATPAAKPAAKPTATPKPKGYDMNLGADRLAYAKGLIEGASGRTEEQDFKEGAEVILRDAIFDRPQSGKENKWLTEMTTILNTKEDGWLWTSEQRIEWLKEVFIDLAMEFVVPSVQRRNNTETPPSYINRNGAEQPWVTMAIENNWLIDTVGNLRAMPANPSARITALLDRASTATGSVEDIAAQRNLDENIDLPNDATMAFTKMIDRILAGGNTVKMLGGVADKVFYNNSIATMIGDQADMTHVHRGAPLSDWVTNNGKLGYSFNWDGDTLAIPAKAPPSDKVQRDTAGRPPVSSKSSNIEDGTVITRPMATLKIKEYISKVVGRLNPKYLPMVIDVENLEAFKRTARYKEAIASRRDGLNTLTEDTAAYSFGTTVVIFRNNVKNRQHLAFLLGHEIIGHFGLASVMSPANLKKLMAGIYDTDINVRAEVDRRMALYGMDKTEATEEAVADLAGHAESSTIIRVWNAIKTFLNKLGVKFSDDMARYYVNQSRRMMRTGTTGDASANGIYEDLLNIQQRYIEGRASNNLGSISGVVRGLTAGNGGGMRGLWHTMEQITSDMKSTDGLDRNVKRLSNAASDAGNVFGKLGRMLQTLDDKALVSRGLQRIFRTFEHQSEHVKQRQSELNDMMVFSHTVNAFNTAPKSETDFNTGPTDAERDSANELLAEATLYGQAQVDEALIRKQPTLLDISPDGLVQRNDKNISEVIDAGLITQEQFEGDGLKYRNYNDAGKPETGANEFSYYKPTFKITPRIWKLYMEQRNAVNAGALMVYEDKVHGMIGARDEELAFIKRRYDLSDEQRDILDRLATMYAEFYEEDSNLVGKKFEWSETSMAKAKVFIYQAVRVMEKSTAKDGTVIGDAKLNDWINGSSHPNDAGLAQFRSDPAKLQAIIADLKILNASKVENAAAIQHTLMDMHLLDTQLVNAEYAAKNTILGSYAPLLRRGPYQVRVQAYKDGKPIQLDDAVRSMLFYTRTETKSEADAMRDQLNAEFDKFDPNTTEVREFSNARSDKERAENTNVITGVTFRAESGDAATAPSLGTSINYDDMVNTLLRAGIKLRDKDRESLVTMTTKQHSTARSRLNRSGNPGWAPNIMRGIAEHLEMQTHIAGKNRYRHHIARIMADKVAAEADLWGGNAELLAKKQDAYLEMRIKNPQKYNDAQRQLAHQEMVAYQHSYVASSTKQGIEIYDRAGNKTKVEGKGRGNRAIADAAKLVEFYNDNVNIGEATGEELFGKFFGKFAALTAAVQLGGNIASAVVNVTSLPLHTQNYLSTYNEKTGFGGGFGPGAAAAAIFRAGRDLSLIPVIQEGKLVDTTGSALALEKWMNAPWSEGEVRHGLTKDEAYFILSLTKKGVLTPNLYNAFIGASRTGKQDSLFQRGMEKWMTLFTKTEQYNRRVTALASYRLEKQRRMEAGATQKDFEGGKTSIAQNVYERAITAVNTSQGNYAQYNRPNWARGNIAQYLYMYKQFQVITIQLLKNMGRKEQMMFLALLVLASGLKGIPFGEDFGDILDTIMQALGIKWEGLEAYVTELAGLIGLPARLIMRGGLDYVMDASVSPRLGHSNLLPGTSYFLAGSDTGRELADIAGPIATAWTGMLSAAAMAARWGAESIGLRPDVTSFADVARTGMGFSALKAIAEGIIFMQDGSITNKKGQVVAKDFGVHEMIFRMLGFYPNQATLQYDLNRMTQRTRDYGDAIKEGYIAAYRKADNSAERSRIRGAVKDWNNDAGRDSPFYIRNFSQAANRAARQAKLTSTGRLLSSAPKSVRQFHKDNMIRYGYDTKGIPTDD